MSTLSLHAHARSVKPALGPSLRSVGYRLGYHTNALLEAVAHHARFGTVEGCEGIDGADVQTLDPAADDDWMTSYADECGPESDACHEWAAETREAVASCSA